jgi:hypothetical protein
LPHSERRSRVLRFETQGKHGPAFVRRNCEQFPCGPKRQGAPWLTPNAVGEKCACLLRLRAPIERERQAESCNGLGFVLRDAKRFLKRPDRGVERGGPSPQRDEPSLERRRGSLRSGQRRCQRKQRSIPIHGPIRMTGPRLNARPCQQRERTIERTRIALAGVFECLERFVEPAERRQRAPFQCARSGVPGQSAVCAPGRLERSKRHGR